MLYALILRICIEARFFFRRKKLIEYTSYVFVKCERSSQKKEIWKMKIHSKYN